MLSEQAPGQALERAMAEGVPYVILDGQVFETDRCSEPRTRVKGEQIDAWYSGKAHRHGGDIQAVMRPDGLPLWADTGAENADSPCSRSAASTSTSPEIR